MKWREFSFAEILWMAHLSTIERMKEDEPKKVRMYLNETKDYTALREWDKSQMKDSQDK